MSDWTDRMNLVCFEPLKYERPWELETYRKIGGYEAWQKILAEQTPRELRHVGELEPFQGETLRVLERPSE